MRRANPSTPLTVSTISNDFHNMGPKGRDLFDDLLHPFTAGDRGATVGAVRQGQFDRFVDTRWDLATLAGMTGLAARTLLQGLGDLLTFFPPKRSALPHRSGLGLLQLLSQLPVFVFQLFDPLSEPLVLGSKSGELPPQILNDLDQIPLHQTEPNNSSPLQGSSDIPGQKVEAKHVLA